MTETLIFLLVFWLATLCFLLPSLFRTPRTGGEISDQDLLRMERLARKRRRPGG